MCMCTCVLGETLCRERDVWVTQTSCGSSSQKRTKRTQLGNSTMCGFTNEKTIRDIIVNTNYLHPECVCDDVCVCVQRRVLVSLYGSGWWWCSFHVWAGVFLWGTVWADGGDGNRTAALPRSSVPDAWPRQTSEPRSVTCQKSKVSPCNRQPLCCNQLKFQWRVS